MTQKTKKKIIAIVGPTASGKTSFAINLAKELSTEIISADSRLVYKGFDIATAKPTKEEMQGIKHHLIDVVEPEYDYSVADFCEAAKLKIDEISQKGKTPIVVGGTGLYFRILLEDFAPPKVAANYELRTALDAKESKELHKLLTELDPESAKKIHFNNKVKIIRAIEVSKTLNMPHSCAASKKEPEYDVQWIGLDFKEREKLYDRINKRVEIMLAEGLVEETRTLLDKHGRINNFVNTIGYQEILKFIDKECSLDEAINEIKQNSRRYAKRQLTWFRRNKLIDWEYF